MANLTSSTILIRRLRLTSPTCLAIEWADGKLSEFRLCDIQRLCTCAACRDELTGQMRIASDTIADDVKALRVVSVGRYALQIYFSSGCSKGIYPFKLLRQWSLST